MEGSARGSADGIDRTGGRGATPDPIRGLRHELRTPINHILGYAELLLEESEGGQGGVPAADLQRILAAGRNLLALVDEFLNPERSGQGGPAMDLELLSHRLRTPLNATIGYAELLQEEATEAGRQHLLADLGRIRDAASHMLGVVNTALDLSTGQRAEDRAGTGEADADERTRLSTEEPRRGHATTGRLLVVDDDEMNRDLLARRLARLGYGVETASSGEQALAMAREQPFDLMLLDIMMPGMSGFEVLQRLKIDHELRELPVIVLSALDEIDDAARCIELGADDYLTKPFNSVLLLARIGASLEKKLLRDRELEYLRRAAQVTGPAAIASLLQRRHGVAGQQGWTGGEATGRAGEEDTGTRRRGDAGREWGSGGAGEGGVSAGREASVGARAVLTDDERSLLDDLERTLEWVSLPKGERLVRQGEPSDSVYVLVYGRLQALQEEGDGQRSILGEIQSGETVGEWGLLSGRPRSATVIATRDSLLARITREAFERLAEKHPRVLTHATRDVVGRLRQAFQARWQGPRVSTIALVPLGPEVPLSDLAHELAAELADLGPTLHLSQARLGPLLGEVAARGLGQEGTDSRLVAWLNDVELQYRFVLYEAEATPSAWTRRCLRQADRVLLVGRADAPSAPRPMEAELAHADGPEIATRRELVLLHETASRLARGTNEWLRSRHVQAHHHIGRGSRADVQRLARRLAGRAVGLVLGGGGLRGAAHIGAIQALLDAGIPIDLIGGTSAGAFVGAQFALGWDCKTMFERTRQLIVEQKALADYTIPLVSLIAARRFVRSLGELYGDARIEDLWRPFFCVSSSLTRAEPAVHREGMLWRKVRASCSIPGVLPPLLEEGELLVDGGLLNNLPADIMSGECDGGPVIAIDLRVKVDLNSQYEFPESLSGTELLRNRLNPFASRKLTPPSILAVMIRSTLLGSVYAGAAQLRHASLYINPPVGQFPLLDGKAIQAMYDLGYQAALEKLPLWQGTRLAAPAGAAREL